MHGPFPSVMSDSTEIFFLRVSSYNRNVCFLCEVEKQGNVIHVGVFVAGNVFLMEGQAPLTSSGIDAARILYLVILDLVFVSC